MFIEYFHRRTPRVPASLCFHFGAGTSHKLELGMPTEIKDEWGYKILADNSDIIRQVEAPKAKKAPKNKMMKTETLKTKEDEPLPEVT